MADKYTEEQVNENQGQNSLCPWKRHWPRAWDWYYQLGLVYEISFEDNGFTEIKMTLTTMGCPLADLLTEQIHDALKEVPEVGEIKVNLVWYPAWTVDKMSRYARIALGIR